MPSRRKRYHLHVFFNTHWDREWLYSFQETRMQLVGLMDRLFEIFETRPEYRYHLDGQSIPLEDFLEIRPQAEDTVKKYVKQGRLLIGPWYVLPDMFSVAGESIVRNILYGHRIGQRFGGWMKVGYSPTGWGQPSQMPQIWQGFGIESASCYRGIATHVAPLEFLWEAPDGSNVLGLRFGKHPRYGFAMYVYRPAVLGRKRYRSEADQDTEVSWQQTGFPFHMADKLGHRSGWFELKPNTSYNRSKIAEGIRLYIENQAPNATTHHIPCLQGFDSSLPNTFELDLVLDAAEQADAEISVSTLPEYVAAVKALLKNPQKVTGELRYPVKDGFYTQTFGSMVSSGIPIKRRNFLAEWQLQKWTEPFAAAACLLGKPYPAPFLEQAWKFLFRVHPHDTIGGCATSRLFADITYRLNQCQDLAENILRESLKHVVSNIDNRDIKGKESALVVFNNLPYPRSELIGATVDFDRDPDFQDVKVCDGEGAEAAHHLEYAEEGKFPFYHPQDRLLSFPATRAKIHFIAEEIPAFGYRAYKITPYSFGELGFSFRPVRGEPRKFASLVTGAQVMENDYLRVKITGDGTLDITDKTNDVSYTGMHYFEDSGESGNAWTHAAPVFDRVITSMGQPAHISKIEDTPLKASFRIELVMRLPEYYDPVSERRSPQLKDFPVTSAVTLSKKAWRVDIETTIDNTVRDHRFRVLFPTHIQTDVSHAETIFDVAERPIEVPECPDWVEPQPMTTPQVCFADLSDGKRGVALINDGLKEYEAVDNPERPIALTLMRGFEMEGFSRTLNKDPAPEANYRQNLGTHTFRYAIYPHRGSWREGEVFREAYCFNSPLRAVQCGGGEGELPKSLSFMELRPAELVISAIKQAEQGDAFVVRFFNPTHETISGTIRFFRELKGAKLLNLLEQPQKELSVEDKHTVRLEVPAKKIIALGLTVKK